MESLSMCMRILIANIDKVLTKYRNSHRSHHFPKFRRRKPVLESVFNKVYLKETPAQVFSGEICENFKNTYFEKHLWTIVSENTSRQAIELQLKVFAF